MDLATKIMNAVQPSIPSGTPQQNSHAQVEDTVPGAFPDTDDEQEEESVGQKNKTSSSHTQRDSGVDIGQPPRSRDLRVDDNAVDTSTTASEQVGDKARVAPTHESETTWSKTLPIRPASGSDADKSSNAAPPYTDEAIETSAHRNVDQSAQNLANEGAGGVSAGPAGWTSTEEVRTRHLGNEGKILGATRDHVEETPTEYSDAPLDRTQPADLSRDGTQLPMGADSKTLNADVEPGQRSSDQLAGVEPSLSHRQMRDLDINRPAESVKSDIDTPSEETWADPSLQAAHQQLQDTPASSNVPVDSTSGYGAHHFGHEHGDPSLAEAQHQLQTNALQSRTATEASGGIHNGVLGAGSDDPKGERGESPHERTSDYRRGHVRNKISGVSESGLGQGGIHNGVVGNGSQAEESARRSFSKEA